MQVVNKLSNDFLHTPTGPPTLIADSGTTSTYISLNCPVLNKKIANRPITIQNPNGQRMQSIHVDELDLPMLRPAARKVHIVPALRNCSLLSMGTVCDAGYTIDLDEHEIKIQDNAGATILSGNRRSDTGMWHIHLPMPNVQVANAIGEPKIPEVVAFAHISLFSPALSTLETALAKGFITNFPGLTASNLR
jgi:hypothetical protein